MARAAAAAAIAVELEQAECWDHEEQEQQHGTREEDAAPQRRSAGNGSMVRACLGTQRFKSKFFRLAFDLRGCLARSNRCIFRAGFKLNGALLYSSRFRLAAMWPHLLIKCSCGSDRLAITINNKNIKGATAPFK
jgi:hypothetical protein